MKNKNTHITKFHHEAGVHYSVFVQSNEPTFKLDATRKFTHGRFALVGCSGLKTLEIIKELINWSEYSLHLQTPEAIVPKLFILDNSIEVHDYWLILQACFSLANEYPDFQKLITENSTRLQACTRHRGVNIVELTLQTIQRLCNIPVENEENFNIDMFQFFKQTVANSTLMRANWLSQTAFRYIQQHNQLPTVVYASNIIECAGYTRIIDAKIADEKRACAEKILSNIRILTQLLFTIHARTSNTRYLEIGRHINPDRLILDRAKDASRAYRYLSQPNYMPIGDSLYAANATRFSLPKYNSYIQSCSASPTLDFTASYKTAAELEDDDTINIDFCGR